MKFSREVADGFSLIELLIVIAIVAFLYSAVIPSYFQYIEETRRINAQQYMLKVSTVLEKRYTRQGYYPASLAQETVEYYDIDYSVNTASSATSYELKATPIESQVNDKCGALQIDNTGTKYSNVDTTTNQNTMGCW